jgi:hypothetical protein
MTDRHLDDAIDRAVREMMSVDADPGFRARVFARLEQPRVRRFTWPGFALIAAAAAVVLAIVLTRTPSPDRAEPQLAGTGPAAAGPGREPEPSSPARVSQPVPDRPSGRALSPRQDRSRSVSAPNVTQELAAGALVATVADAADAGFDADQATADQIAPIIIAPLEQTAIAAAPIVIAPLAPIVEVRIAPLSPRIERD